ncbi:MAG: ComF family protein [Cyanobacteriota bacterium erpe_2018_sw_39hr_WHONDRS-SW48-000098_B_bin.30]|nr:ComF family protein [Cyanobacteriota bacterium erpe_2018_sw_39hr_WHONDRS-SW48-000098_B_bin.30]
MSTLKQPTIKFKRWRYSAEHHLASLFGGGPCRLCHSPELQLTKLHGLPFMPRKLCSDCLLTFVQEPLKGIIVVPDLNEPIIIQYHSAAPYQGDLRKIIHMVKYEGDQMLALDLPPLLIPALRLSLDNECDNILVPVPLHPDKLRERGFNQCHVLARGLHLLATTTGADLRLAPDLLMRTIYTRPQKGLKAIERQANVAGAFSTRARLKGEHIIILDDVLTSGATISTCARVLLQSGASKVSALTLGRASWRNPPSSAQPAETWEQLGTV